MSEDRLSDENGRIAALERLSIIDSMPEAPFDKITSLVQKVMSVPICAVSLVDRERQWFKSICGLGIRETPRSVSFCTHTIKTREPLLVRDALQDPLFRHNPLVLGAPFIRSYAGVPLQTPDGYNVGALCAIDTVPREFSDAQLNILRSFAALVVDELELRRIAARDHLTGALTRRGFIEQLKKEIAGFQRHKRNSVLVLLDIDHFKQVNDTYGHPAGDTVLKTVSARLHEQLRAGDSLGRVGGEEFAILLSDTDLEGGCAAAEKFRKAIEALRIDVAGGMSVTASFGTVAIQSVYTRPEDWLAEADKALYQAKREGRNRCVAGGCSAPAMAA